MPRLRRTSPSQPGWTRRRAGRGFIYLDGDGRRIKDAEILDRLGDLVIPPAWQDVWLCPFPNGHLQAVGTDAAGRRQYLYHPAWSEQRATKKHERVLGFARRLPAARRTVRDHLARPGMPRERALAVGFRLLDRGLFRIGGEQYAEEHGSYGLATLRKEHVQLDRDTLAFDFPAKSGNRRTMVLTDAEILDAVGTLRRRRSGGEELLAYRDGGRWRDVGSDDLNTYLKDVVGPDASAKDFRTWHGTVLAAVALAGRDRPRSESAGRREVARAVKQVSQYLGNTPAVCRASYIDPKVLDRYREGRTIDARRRPEDFGTEADLVELPAPSPATERAVLGLLGD
ncbi:DNA topoisomerase IB [Spongisporangium articulatum]|uniref:DNA topoisomerase n=1 Tax=Spongisporangium articulatum TaxID=3362603 RepID=A0ABW8AGR9_9ACTN